MQKITTTIAATLLLISSHVFAATTAYTDAAFNKLMQEGKPILLAVHADWCPTCKRQQSIIDDLTKQKKLEGIAVMRIDFDNQEAAVEKFKAQQQSTLIVFKGGKEVGRSIAVTSPEGIAQLVQKTQ